MSASLFTTGDERGGLHYSPATGETWEEPNLFAEIQPTTTTTTTTTEGVFAMPAATLPPFSVYGLALRASCCGPTSEASPGALFLRAVADEVEEHLDNCDDATCQRVRHAPATSEIADRAPNVYTVAMWAQFVELGAYREPAPRSSARPRHSRWSPANACSRSRSAWPLTCSQRLAGSATSSTPPGRRLSLAPLATAPGPYDTCNG